MGTNLPVIVVLSMITSGTCGLSSEVPKFHAQMCSLMYLLFCSYSFQLLIFCFVLIAACCCCITSVVSDSVRPHRWQPTRLPCPWDSLGKNTGVGCHFLLQCMKVKSQSEVAQLCLTPSDPMDCSLPGSPVHGTFQARYWSGVPSLSPNCSLLSIKYLSLNSKA